MHRRERRRDEYGRFLPREFVNLREETKRDIELSFEDASPDFPAGSSSITESFDTKGLQPFEEILASYLTSSDPNPPVVNHPVANIPFQQPLHNPIPQLMA